MRLHELILESWLALKGPDADKIKKILSTKGRDRPNIPDDAEAYIDYEFGPETGGQNASFSSLEPGTKGLDNSGLMTRTITGSNFPIYIAMKTSHSGSLPGRIVNLIKTNRLPFNNQGGVEEFISDLTDKFWEKRNIRTYHPHIILMPESKSKFNKTWADEIKSRYGNEGIMTWDLQDVSSRKARFKDLPSIVFEPSPGDNPEDYQSFYDSVMKAFEKRKATALDLIERKKKVLEKMKFGTNPALQKELKQIEDQLEQHVDAHDWIESARRWVQYGLHTMSEEDLEMVKNKLINVTSFLPYEKKLARHFGKKSDMVSLAKMPSKHGVVRILILDDSVSTSKTTLTNFLRYLKNEVFDELDWVEYDPEYRGNSVQYHIMALSPFATSS